MITATVKPYSQLTAEEESQWYDANHESIKWGETPEQAYERLNAPKKVDADVKECFDGYSVRLALIEESGYTLKCNGFTFWVTDK